MCKGSDICKTNGARQAVSLICHTNINNLIVLFFTHNKNIIDKWEGTGCVPHLSYQYKYFLKLFTNFFVIYIIGKMTYRPFKYLQLLCII